MKRSQFQTGVRSIDDMKDRCVINDETGCWMWKGAVTLSRGRKSTGIRYETPTCSVPLGVFGNEKHTTMPALRFAWLLAGGVPKRGQVVYRAKCNEPRCVNPDHAAQATRKEVGRLVVESGRLRNNPQRQKVNLRSSIKSAVSADVVREIEAGYAEGLSQGEVRARFGIGQKLAKSVRIGVHVNSSARQLVVPHASVFTWRPAS